MLGATVRNLVGRAKISTSALKENALSDCVSYTGVNGRRFR